MLPLTLLLAAPAPAADPPAYRGDVTAVSVVRHVDKHPAYNRLWIPVLARWGPRHLLVAFGGGLAGKTDMGDILCSASTDEGKTWGTPVTVFDHREKHGTVQFAYANPVLFRPPGQDVIWLFAMRCPLVWRHSEDADLCAAYTADGGRTWVPVELAMHYTGPVIIVGDVHAVMENGRPRYLLPVHRNTKRNDPRGTRDQFVLESTSLLDWRLPKGSGPEPGFIPPPTGGPPVFLHEGLIAPWGDGLKMVMRAARGDKEGQALDPPRAYSSQSRDGGRTWTPAAPEPDLPNAVSKGWFGRSDAGPHLYVYNDGPAGERKALRYKLRPAAGGWGPERPFYDSGTKNSYPTLLEHAPGKFYAVWDSGTDRQARTHIRFGKFEVK